MSTQADTPDESAHLVEAYHRHGLPVWEAALRADPIVGAFLDGARAN